MVAPYSLADGLLLQDDFISNDVVTDNNIGQLNWQTTGIGNAGTTAYVLASPYGVLRNTTAGTADGDGDTYHLLPDALVLGSAPGYFRFRCRYPTITGNALAGNNFRIGLDDSVTATSPAVGIWVDSDAGVLSLQCDSADHGDNAAAVAGVPTLTSGTTMVIDTWHNFDVRWHGENAQGGPKNVHLWVDGWLAAVSVCQIDNDEEVEPKIAHWQDTGGAATLEFDIDYFELFISR